MDIIEIGKRIVGPILDIIKGKQDRKKALQQVESKIKLAQTETEGDLVLKRHEVEALAVKGLSETWRDEYVTVSVVSIFNLIVLGGILTAFGYPQVLEGIAVSVTALEAAGVDLGFLMTAAVLTSLGVYTFKRS
jgi:hypothetical protein